MRLPDTLRSPKKPQLGELVRASNHREKARVDLKPYGYVLLADESAEELDPVREQLRGLGFSILWVASAKDAIEVANRSPPALVVMDLIRPDQGGFDLCRALRRWEATSKIPIIIVSACADESDRVLGLELGADDYVIKPFNTQELLLRAKKLLQQGWNASMFGLPPIRVGELEIDLAGHSVSVEGIPIEFTVTEIRLLDLLARRSGEVQRRSDLLRVIWNFRVGANSRTLDIHVRRVRRKLRKAGHYLETVRGVGYRLNGTIGLPAGDGAARAG